MFWSGYGVTFPSLVSTWLLKWLIRSPLVFVMAVGRWIGLCCSIIFSLSLPFSLSRLFTSMYYAGGGYCMVIGWTLSRPTTVSCCQQSEMLFDLKCRNWTGEGHPSTPTAVEMQLPWKRDDADDMSTFAVKQSEFPLWVDNKEYNNYYSPTNTFLGTSFISHSEIHLRALVTCNVVVVACRRIGQEENQSSVGHWYFHERIHGGFFGTWPRTTAFFRRDCDHPGRDVQGRRRWRLCRCREKERIIEEVYYDNGCHAYLEEVNEESLIYLTFSSIHLTYSTHKLEVKEDSCFWATVPSIWPSICLEWVH